MVKKIVHEALSFLQDITSRLKDYKVNDQMQLFIKKEIVKEIKELYTIRYNRIKMESFAMIV